MYRLFLAAIAVGWVALGGLISSAQAAFTATPTLFFVAPTDGTLTFTYEGFSADDVDHMAFAFNGNALFTNKTAVAGTVIHEAVSAGQRYQLSLHNDQTGDTWSSNPASNWGIAHLASTNAFSDFHLGRTAPTPVNMDCAISGGCYLGWEDLPPGADNDFNDLVFALQFIQITSRSTGDPIPEPSALRLLATGLFGLGVVTRRVGLGSRPSLEIISRWRQVRSTVLSSSGLRGWSETALLK